MDNPYVLALLFFSLIVIGLVLVHVSEMRAKSRGIRSLFAGRERLDERQFHERYSQAQGIPFHVVSGVRRIMEKRLGADLSRLSPEDRFYEELRPFYDYDHMADVEIVIELEKEFDIKLSDEDTMYIRSVRELVETIWEKVRQKPA